MEKVVKVPKHIQSINAQRKLQQLDNAETIGKLYCEGLSQREISEKLGIHRDTVLKALNLIRKVWRDRLGNMIEAHKAEQLAKIDRIESEAWDAWWESKKAIIEIKKENETSEDGFKKKKSLLKKFQVGEVRYLELASKQVELRSKILGLYSPDSTGPSSTPLLEVIVSTRAEAAKMLPYMEFASEVVDGEVIPPGSSEGGDDASSD